MIDLSFVEEDRCNLILYPVLYLNIELTSYFMRSRHARAIYGLDAARERTIAEACAPGANFSAVARSYEMAPSQLFKWRREAQRQSGVPAGSEVQAEERSDALSFVEVASIGGGIGQKPPVDLREHHISDVTIRVGDGVCVEHIIDLIRAVRRA